MGEMILDYTNWAFVVVLLVLPIAYELNSTFKYCTKFFLYYTLVMVSAVVIFFPSLLRPKDVTNYRYVKFLVQGVRRLFGIEVEVQNREYLQSDKPFILISNHQSSIDLIGMMEIWPSRCTSLAKKELLWAGPFGITAWLCGTIFINRADRSAALSTMASAAEIIKRENVKVYVFPEGTRNHGGSMLPFKKGAFLLAMEAQVPVVPVVFSSYSEFYSKKDYKFEPGKFLIRVLPPVPTEGLTKEDIPELMESIRKSMLDTFSQLSLESRSPRLNTSGR